MRTVSSAYARANLASLMEEITRSGEPVAITRETGGHAVAMSKQQYDAVMRVIENPLQSLAARSPD